MRRAQELLLKVMEDSGPEATKYDSGGRIAIMGTNKRDQAAILKDMVSSFKILGEISRDATEQHIAVTKLMAGILGQSAPVAPTIHLHYAPSTDADTDTPAPPEPPTDGGSQGDPTE